MDCPTEPSIPDFVDENTARELVRNRRFDGEYFSQIAEKNGTVSKAKFESEFNRVDLYMTYDKESSPFVVCRDDRKR